MSWSDIFPVFTEELTDAPNFLSLLESIPSQATEKQGYHLIVAGYPETSDSTKQSLLSMANQLRESGRDLVFRIYVSESQRNEVSDFLDLECEISVMRPCENTLLEGCLWPLLALEENRLVTISHPSRVDSLLADIERTETAARAGLGGWRIPRNCPTSNNQVGYFPIDSRCLGSCHPLPIRTLLNSFIHACQSGNFMPICHPPWGGELDVASSKWPEIGFEIWFLLAALYPRMAAAGLLTIIPNGGNNLLPFLPIDIEYCTWANPASEVILGPPAQTQIKHSKAVDPKPWDGAEVGSLLHIRPGASPYRRQRRRMGPMQKIYESEPHPEVLKLTPFDGNLQAWLLHCSERDHDAWWIDFNPLIQPSQHGGDLFLDRCYDESDAVVCGTFLIRLDENAVLWSQGFGISNWKVGQILRVPKLEGPLTLWRAEFGRQFFREWQNTDQGIRPEVILRAKMDLNLARVYETTAKRMGWSVR